MALSSKLHDLIVRDPGRVLGASDLRELDEKFKRIDVDGDGEITRVELRAALGGDETAPFVTESRVDAFLRDVDLDGDGQLTFEELVSSTALHRAATLMARLEHELEARDARCETGGIAEPLLDDLLEIMGLDDWAARAAIVADVDRGQDGLVHPEALLLAFFTARKA